MSPRGEFSKSFLLGARQSTERDPELSRRLILIVFSSLSRVISSARLGVEASSRIFVEKLARDVRPEFLKYRADCAFSGDDQPVVDGLADAFLIRGIVQI